MHECNNNFAFPSHSFIYTAILNIYYFFFPLVYNSITYAHTLSIKMLDNVDMSEQEWSVSERCSLKKIFKHLES